MFTVKIIKVHVYYHGSERKEKEFIVSPIKVIITTTISHAI